MTEPTDARLVAGVRRGDRESASLLAHRYLRPARAVALSILGEVSSAEDVCQDAFVYAIERIDDCRQPERFGAWLFQIVRNRSRNHIRDSRWDRTDSLDEVPLASRTPLPDRDAERSQLRDRLARAVAEIGEERAAVLLLHDLEGWTHREIAEQMEIPVGTARSHLHHARGRLRHLLQELRDEDG